MAEVSCCPVKVGNGYDVHQIAEGLPMWLGGVLIGTDCGFVAHSDGDVAIHALGSLTLSEKEKNCKYLKEFLLKLFFLSNIVRIFVAIFG